METMETFADGGFTTANTRWEIYLEKSIMEYIESNTVMRNFCYIYPVPLTTFTARIPTDQATGLAVELAEGAEVPVVRQETSSFDVKVIKYGTGAFMTDEDKEVDWLGILGQRQVTEAGKRMLRKENADILAVLLAGAGDSSPASTTGTLKYEDLVLARADMINNTYANYKPDLVLVNADQEADLQVDERFTDASKSGTTQTLREGVVGRIAGMDVVSLPEMPTGTAILMDTAEDPLWLAVRQSIRTEQERLPRRQADAFYVTTWEKPVVTKPDAIYKITSC